MLLVADTEPNYEVTREDPETVNARFFMPYYHNEMLMGNLSNEKIKRSET